MPSLWQTYRALPEYRLFLELSQNATTPEARWRYWKLAGELRKAALARRPRRGVRRRSPFADPRSGA